MESKEAIEVMKNLCNLMKKVDCEIKLVNGNTGETVQPDAKAINAGLLAGIAAGMTIIQMESLPESKDDYLAVVSEIVGNAGKIYLAYHLDAKGDEVDNG